MNNLRMKQVCNEHIEFCDANTYYWTIKEHLVLEMGLFLLGINKHTRDAKDHFFCTLFVDVRKVYYLCGR